MNDAIVEAIKITAYRESGIEGAITFGIPNPIVFKMRADELYEHNKANNIEYTLDLAQLMDGIFKFIDKMIKKYSIDIDPVQAKVKASKAAGIAYNHYMRK